MPCRQKSLLACGDSRVSGHGVGLGEGSTVTDLTAEKIAELLRVEAAASRAPWLQPIEDEPRLISDASGVMSLLALTQDDEAIVGSDEDAALIVAMRNNFRPLLLALEATKRELHKLRYEHRFKMGSREMRCSLCKKTDDLCECQPPTEP